jgi:regulator of replication initiation timing
MRSEKEILCDIDNLNEALFNYRQKISALKNKLMNAETVFIGLKLTETKLKDELRYMRDHSVMSDDQKIRNDATDKEFATRVQSLIDKNK